VSILKRAWAVWLDVWYDPDFRLFAPPLIALGILFART
jgi:hypothetical protein